MLRDFTFKIFPLPRSINILGLKYISSEVNADYSIIYLNSKFNSEKFFVSESKSFIASFFSIFFREYPEVKVLYNDLSFSFKNEEIKESESCEDVFNKMCIDMKELKMGANIINVHFL